MMIVALPVMFDVYDRFHYTIDVEIAIALVIIAWKLYHNSIRTRYLLTQSKFFIWFEGGSQRDTMFTM